MNFYKLTLSSIPEIVLSCFKFEVLIKSVFCIFVVLFSDLRRRNRNKQLGMNSIVKGYNVNITNCYINEPVEI